MKSQSIKTVFKNIDSETFKVILNNITPVDKIIGNKIPKMTEWRWCDVMDLLEKINQLTPFEIVELAVKDKVDENTLLKTEANEFMGFLKFLLNESEQILQLMGELKKEPKTDLVRAGIDKLNVFGNYNIYYSISKNPLDWDEISEVPFYKMYTKLLMDKVNEEINERYQEIQIENSKEKNKKK